MYFPVSNAGTFVSDMIAAPGGDTALFLSDSIGGLSDFVSDWITEEAAFLSDTFRVCACAGVSL